MSASDRDRAEIVRLLKRIRTRAAVGGPVPREARPRLRKPRPVPVPEPAEEAVVAEPLPPVTVPDAVPLAWSQRSGPVSPRAWVSQKSRSRNSISGDLWDKIF